MKTALITGISGQDGAYLAKFLLEKGYEVYGLIRNGDFKSTYNLRYLKIFDQVRFKTCDLSSEIVVAKTIDEIKPDEVYNLAAQSSVGISFQHPLKTMQFNCVSVINLLEVLRLSNNKFRLFQPLSSEMYGAINPLPISEKSIISPTSPYATSKAFAYWAVKNYREAYDLYAATGILFNHESFLRTDNFFVKKVIVAGLKIKKGELDCLRVGNIDVKRDMGFAPEYVKAMWMILQANHPDDFIICSGKSISLRDIVYYVFDKFNIPRDKIVQDPNLFRPAELTEIYGDCTKIRSELNWNFEYSFLQVLDKLIEEEIESQKYVL